MTPAVDIPEKARVSIAERLVPAIGFAVAATVGAVGGLMTLRNLSALRNAENAGFEAFFGATAEVEAIAAAILLFAAFLGVFGIAVSAVRMFTTNTTASPSGIRVLAAGLLSLLPAFGIHLTLHMLEGAVINGVAVSSVAQTVTMLTYISMAGTVVVLLALLAFAFVPVSARLGRRYSTMICLVIVEAAVIGMAAIFFWQASEAMAHAGSRLF
jgi:hypothetical protein